MFFADKEIHLSKPAERAAMLIGVTGVFSSVYMVVVVVELAVKPKEAACDFVAGVEQ